MNEIIVEAIRATGVANDQMLNAADVRDINAYIRTHYATQWITLHGDDEDTVRDRFPSRPERRRDDLPVWRRECCRYGRRRHLSPGFEIQCGRLLNEDGNENATLKDVAFWLNKLLAKQLAKSSSPTPSVDLTARGRPARAWISLSISSPSIQG